MPLGPTSPKRGDDEDECSDLEQASAQRPAATTAGSGVRRRRLSHRERAGMPCPLSRGGREGRRLIAQSSSDS
jgi:hypothetical protein